jgi:pyridoxal phosphate enzyme (YggS family)
MSSVVSNLEAIRAQLPEGVTLVAVSKFHPAEAIREAYDAGQRIFGESREQEFKAKVEALPSDIEWHFIGHLQTNKVRAVVPHASLIHSVDSARLLTEIDKAAARIGRRVDILLQAHVAQEESKYGFLPEELIALLSERGPEAWPNVRIRGVMGMASLTDDEAQIAREFGRLRALFDELQSRFFAAEPSFDTRSYGMSDDWHIALREGSNMVRIGSSIFGARQY